MYQTLSFCVYMTAFSSTTTIFNARKLSLKDSLSCYCCATSLCSCSSSSSSPSSSSSLVLLLESLSSFSVIAYSSGYMKQYTLSLTSGLRFVIILLPAALLKWFPCKSCAMYAASRSKSNSETFSTSMHPSGTARQGGYRRHFGRSLPSGFPTQILCTRWTLFPNHFFFLAFDFRQFSFFSSSLADAVCM